MTVEFTPVKRKSKEEVLEEFRVQTIQDAVIRVIALKGLADATMQDIADEAGIAKGTIYLYFKDRQVLLEQTVEAKFSELNRRLDEAFASTDGSYAERFTRIVRTQVGFFEENAGFFRVLIAMNDRDRCAAGERQKRQNPRFRSHVQRLTTFFENGIRDGAIRDVDPQRLAWFVAEGTRGLIFNRVDEKQSPELDADIRLIVSTIFNGISERGKH